MKAVVFAAGIGSRLKPFTDHHPKALAPLAGKPVLGHVIDKLMAAGADDIVVNVHHFPSQIISYLSENYPHVGVSDESALLLDTAGGLAKIYRENAFRTPLLPSEPVIIHNADIFTDFSLCGMLEAHKEGRATLLVDPARKSSRELLFDEKKMIGWRNVKTGMVRPSGIETAGLQPAAFGGVHIISGNILAAVDEYVGAELTPCSIMDFYIDSCAKIDIVPFTPVRPYRWFDIGTPEKLSAARKSVENQ